MLGFDTVHEMLNSKGFSFFDGYDYSLEKTLILLEKCRTITEKAELYQKICSVKILGQQFDLMKNEIAKILHQYLLFHFENEINNLRLAEYKQLHESLSQIGSNVVYKKEERELLILRVELKWKEKTEKEFLEATPGELIKLFSLCKSDDPVRYKIAKELNDLKSR